MDDETRKQMNVEETFAALDRIIGKLEKGDGSLEDAFADYEEGMRSGLKRFPPAFTL